MGTNDTATAIMAPAAQPPHNDTGHNTHTEDKDPRASEESTEKLDEKEKEGQDGNNEGGLEADRDEVERSELDASRKETMAMVNNAITAATEVGTEDSPDLGLANGGLRHISVKFVDSEYYVIPWSACYSWKVVLVLLKKYYSNSNKKLADIESNSITVEKMGHGLVSPETWEHAVEHGKQYFFFPHSSYDSDSDSDSDSEPDYQDRLRYTVNYFEVNSKDRDGCLVAERTYDEPVQVSTVHGDTTMPALEEIKTVQTPHYQHTKDDAEAEVKAKLGPLDRVRCTSLKINSSYLLNILKSVIEYASKSPDGEVFGLVSGEFDYPYKDLFHHMDDLMRYKTNESGLRSLHSASFNERADSHIDLLIGYLSSQRKIPFGASVSTRREKLPVTTFAAYWLLLKPGTDVYVREEDGLLNAYIVHAVDGGVIEVDGKAVNVNYQVSVWNLICDGEYARPAARNIPVPVFDNEKEVKDLPVFPVDFNDSFDGGRLKQKLTDRGKRYLAYTSQPCFLQYSGTGLADAKYKRARVVVTHERMPTHLTSHNEHRVPEIDDTLWRSMRVASCECHPCADSSTSQGSHGKNRFHDYFWIHTKSSGEISAHQYMLMGSHVYAFMLKERTYDLLAVEGLEEPVMVDTAIDRLVMDSNNKELIKAVAQVYTDSDRPDRFSGDFIRGKGEGQIILLHGPPGTGKTLTAESVAEYTRRPLLSITAADLGHESQAMERSLLRYFKDASDWGAIVLLDEADVYLEQRTMHDLSRNSIVSVFLRALDYFEGILFLTTNRVGQFDEAFISRIHLSLGYDKLTNESRSKIWDNMFRKLKDDHKRGGREILYEYHAKSYVKSKEVQSLEWNGREIRNAFQTAVALAIFDAKRDKKEPPEMTEKHLNQVVQMSSAFRKYMTAAHSGMDDSTWAFKHGNREDKFPSTPAKTDS